MSALDEARPAGEEPSTALVLAGGGALGAYEAGVLHFLADGLSRELGRQPRFNVFAGTSVGALNAFSLAEYASDPRQSIIRTVEFWRSLTFNRVLLFRRRELLHLVRMVLGRGPGAAFVKKPLPRPPEAPHPPVAGIFDTLPLVESMEGLTDPARLQQAFSAGTVRGVALCATEVCTGKAIVFYQTAEGIEYRPGRDPAKEAFRVRLSLKHALASAAMPFLFPAVQIDGVCYTDGAMRQNTPLNPALRLGAERVLVISVTQDPYVAARVARIGCRRNPYPGAFFLLGKMVNVLLAQSLDHELDRVEMYNRLIVGGEELFGPDFVPKLNRVLSGYRNARYRQVRTCHIRPSRDLHTMALQSLRDAPQELVLPGPSGGVVTWILNSGAVAESELLAYLLFTPTFIGRLLELGYEDARAQREDLLRFFRD